MTDSVRFLVAEVNLHAANVIVSLAGAVGLAVLLNRAAHRHRGIRLH
jgi:hypothetical protein